MKSAKTKTKTAQDIQDEIFRKMPASKKLKLASDFSMFLIELNKITNRQNGLPKTTRKSR